MSVFFPFQSALPPSRGHCGQWRAKCAWVLVRSSMAQAHQASLAVSAETNTRNDGSFVGYELGRGGLGAHAEANDVSDPYAAYRRGKSGRYHLFMASKSTNPNRPPMGH